MDPRRKNWRVIRLWDPAKGKLLDTLPRRDRPLHTTFTDLTFSPDGKWLVCGDLRHKISWWETATRKQVRFQDMDGAGWTALAFWPDGKKLAAGLGNRMVVWDSATGKQLSSHLLKREGMIRDLKISPGGRWLAIAWNNGEVEVYKE